MQSPPSWPPPDWRRRRPPPGQRLLSPAAVLLLAVLLLGSQPAARAQRVSEFLTALWGARCFHPPAGEERVTLKCLHTVAPPPFNWTMNCPEQAEITDSMTGVGARVRVVKMPPQRGVTREMVLWFMSPLFPRFVRFNGHKIPWYILWHPLDHHSAVLRPIGLNPRLPGLPGIHVDVTERYRTLGPPEEPHGDYKLMHVSVFAERPVVERLVLQDRFTVSVYVGPLQVLEILHKFEDTPEGLVTTLTYMDGLVHEKTPLLNILSNKLLADMLRELCFDDFLNAVTRHSVEEFGNFVHFLPQAWNEYHRGQKLGAALNIPGVG